MSDSRLRELERAFAESGSDEDEAAWLLERVRPGELTQARVDLATILRLEATSQASGSEVEARVRAALEQLPDPMQRLFASDCAEKAVCHWEVFAPEDVRPQAAISTARRYARGEATAAELETARAGAEAASWCTAINAADAAEAAHAAASKEVSFATWAADVAVRVGARAYAQRNNQVEVIPFEDTDFTTFDKAMGKGRQVHLAWSLRRLADYLLNPHPGCGPSGLIPL